MPLPCTHLSPASRMLHFEESTTIGTREMSGSDAISDRKRAIAASESSSPSSMFTSINCAPFSTCWRATSSPASKSPSLMSLRKRAEPVTLVRSPMLAKSESGPRLSGSSPERRERRSMLGGRRGGRSATASAMASMCAGTVPQHPPTMFRKPARANSPS